MDSLTEPIWFTFSSRALQDFSSMAFWTRLTFVTDHLGGSADESRELLPGSPIILIEGVFDRNQREVLAEVSVELRQLLARHLQRWGLLFVRVPGAEVVAVL